MPKLTIRGRTKRALITGDPSHLKKRLPVLGSKPKKRAKQRKYAGKVHRMLKYYEIIISKPLRISLEHKELEMQEMK